MAITLLDTYLKPVESSIVSSVTATMAEHEEIPVYLEGSNERASQQKIEVKYPSTLLSLGVHNE